MRVVWIFYDNVSPLNQRLVTVVLRLLVRRLLTYLLTSIFVIFHFRYRQNLNKIYADTTCTHRFSILFAL